MASVTDHPARPDSTTGLGSVDGVAAGRAHRRPGVAAAGPALAGLGVTLAAGAAILGLGRFLEDPAAAAEAGYLATLSVLLLGCVAALPPRGGNPRGSGSALLPWSALAVVTAVWVLPAGPGRGATVLALLVTTVALAAGRAGLPAALSPGGAGTRSDSDLHPGSRTLSAILRATGALLPLLVAVQVVFRGGELLRPAVNAHTLVVFLAMPLAAAAATAFLALRRGAAPVGIAAASVILWTGGLDVAATVTLLALAAGQLLRDTGRPDAGPRDPGTEDPPDPAAAPPRRRALLLRACALAILVAPFAWQPRTAAVAAGAGLLMTGGAAAGAAVATAAVAALFLAPVQGWTEVASLLGLVLLLLPLAPWLAARSHSRSVDYLLTLAGGMALAVAAARCAPALATTPGGEVTVPALAAPLALLALYAAAGPGAGGAPAGPGLALQRLWSGGLLLAAGVVSAYPWLRPDATRSVLAALGLHPDGLAPLVTAAVATLAAAALAALNAYVARRGGRGGFSDLSRPLPQGDGRATGWAHLALMLTAFLILTAHAAPAAPFGHTLVGHPGILLSHGAPRFATDLASTADEPREIRRLELVGNLVRAEDVADGTTVATVTLLAGDRPLVSWPLTAGGDLGEWAARRPAVAATLRHRPPRPWASWVAPGGDYLGQVYRARHVARVAADSQPAAGGAAGPEADDQAEPGSPLRLVLQRDPGLAPQVQVHVHRLEAWP